MLGHGSRPGRSVSAPQVLLDPQLPALLTDAVGQRRAQLIGEEGEEVVAQRPYAHRARLVEPRLLQRHEHEVVASVRRSATRCAMASEQMPGSGCPREHALGALGLLFHRLEQIPPEALAAVARPVERHHRVVVIALRPQPH